MSRNQVSVFLSLLFVLLISTPTVISVVDDSVDIAIFFDSAEEEEKGHEKNKELEILCSNLDLESINGTHLENRDNLGYYFKNYPKPHLNLILPPPEGFIL